MSAQVTLHELTHALAFSPSLFGYFRDASGLPRVPRNSEYWGQPISINGMPLFKRSGVIGRCHASTNFICEVRGRCTTAARLQDTISGLAAETNV